MIRRYLFPWITVVSVVLAVLVSLQFAHQLPEQVAVQWTSGAPSSEDDVTKTHLTHTIARAGLAALFAGATLVAGAGQASAAPIDDHGFVDGPSCDPAEGFPKVIGETELTTFVFCQKNGSWPPAIYQVQEFKRKPVPARTENVSFGPGTYVVTYLDGSKDTYGRDYVSTYNPGTGASGHYPATMYKFEV